MGKELVSLVAGKKLEGGDNIKLCWKGPASKVYRYRVVKEEANGRVLYLYRNSGVPLARGSVS